MDVLAVGQQAPDKLDDAASNASAARPRVLGRRRPLPGGRAVVGGFFVSLAAVGVFATYIAATTSHRAQFVVANQDLGVGQRITAQELSVEPMELPSGLARAEAFRSPGTLVGAVVVAPVRAGELIQVSDVVQATGAPDTRTLSFSIDPSRALNGALQDGDIVDAIATFGTGSGATTVVAAQGLRVIAIANSSSSLSTGSSSEVITVSLRGDTDLLALVQAVNAGQVVLVRATGASDLPSGATYQQPTPPSSATGP